MRRCTHGGAQIHSFSSMMRTMTLPHLFQHPWSMDACSTSLIEDKDLSWEDFTQATPCMVHSMEQNDWPPDHINMFIKFWTALENHLWRHADDTFSQRVLLVYQGEQRKRWHLSVGTKVSWLLAKICSITLAETWSNLVHRARIQEVNKWQRVSQFLVPVLHTITHHFSSIYPPLYCHQLASTVGMISTHIDGSHPKTTLPHVPLAWNNSNPTSSWVHSGKRCQFCTLPTSLATLVARAV